MLQTGAPLLFPLRHPAQTLTAKPECRAWWHSCGQPGRDVPGAERTVFKKTNSHPICFTYSSHIICGDSHGLASPSPPWNRKAQKARLSQPASWEESTEQAALSKTQHLVGGGGAPGRDLESGPLKVYFPFLITS
jgi:hypothetical protein